MKKSKNFAVLTILMIVIAIFATGFAAMHWSRVIKYEKVSARVTGWRSELGADSVERWVDFEYEFRGVLNKQSILTSENLQMDDTKDFLIEKSTGEISLTQEAVNSQKIGYLFVAIAIIASVFAVILDRRRVKLVKNSKNDQYLARLNAKNPSLENKETTLMSEKSVNLILENSKDTQ